MLKIYAQNKWGIHLISDIQQKIGILLDKDEDFESIFSKEEKSSDQTIFALQVPEEMSNYYICLDYPKQGSISSAKSQPQTLVHILPIKYDKPIPTVAFFDTGAAISMMNQSILLEEL